MLTFSQRFAVNDIGVVEDSNGKAHIAFDTGKESYANIIGDAVRTLVGELQLDIERGIPYLETVFNSPRDVELWKHYVRKAVEEFDFVESIDSFHTEWDASKELLSYRMEITTTEGTVEVTNG